ncbi:hypothetical protein GN956_G6302 [Arapaima gigas]
MEREGLPDFKAIRAKFQEEITLNQIRNKPAIPSKPKQVPSAGPTFPFLSATSTASENTPAVVPRLAFKDTKRCLVFKRPVSHPLPLPPCTPPLFNGDESARCSFRDKRFSLVLPVQPKEQRSHRPVLFSGLPQCDKQQKQASFVFKLASPEPIKEPSFTGPFKYPVEESIMVETAIAPLQLYPNPESLSQNSDVPASLPFSEEAGSGSMWSTDLPSNLDAFQNINTEHISGPVLSLTSSDSRSAGCGAHHPAVNIAQLRSPTDQLKEEFFKKCTGATKSTSMSGVASKVNGSAHRKVIETLEEIMGSGTKALPQRCQAETLPPKVPLPSLQSIGPKPEKPPRPVFVDLCPYWTAMLKTQCMLNYLVTAPQALDHPKLHRADNNAKDLWNQELPDTTPSDLKANEIKSLHPVHKAFSAAELETQEPKVSGVKALGLWAKALDFEVPEFTEQGAMIPEASQIPFPATITGSLKSAEVKHPARCDTSDNVYEDVENVRKLHRGHHTWKRKSIPKSKPFYARKSTWFHNAWFGMPGELHNFTHSHGDGPSRKVSPESREDKELKKKEKHRLERERKEQKEREKKEQEMKKKFKITGEEEPMYQAKVTVASKGRKGDLPVQIGDVVNIIRTTNCPKGKWLARDNGNRYGYIPVMNLELDIKEMLELGKKASQVAGRGTMEGDSISDGSRSSNQWTILTSSFTDSEEWTCDEESISSPSDARWAWTACVSDCSLCLTAFTNDKAPLPFSDISSEDSSMLAKHEALQRLASFFEQQQEIGDVAENEDMYPAKTEERFRLLSSIEEQTYFSEQDDFQLSDLMILPPPEPYADRG